MLDLEKVVFMSSVTSDVVKNRGQMSNVLFVLFPAGYLSGWKSCIHLHALRPANHGPCLFGVQGVFLQ